MLRDCTVQRLLVVTVTVVAAVAGRAPAARTQQEPARGVIVDDVKCASDAAQSYALYLPSTYSRDRGWSLLMAFHPAARGRAMVEKYQVAAERYGYIVAGSNTSRNGSFTASAAAVKAMSADLGQRFAIDASRVYLTGMSGGARVALMVALGSKGIAGVIASSAGYPDSKPRASVPFPIYGTAGTEDFNYLEMRQLDRRLTTPHRLAIFDGGHTLPPDEVALDAIEWMELQAMKSSLRPKDDALVARWFEKRQQQIASADGAAAAVPLLEALVDDFKGIRDVSAESARAKELAAQPEVKKALARQRSEDDAESRRLAEMFELEAGLADESRHAMNLGRLRDQLLKYKRAAESETDSPERRQARRLLRSVTFGAADRVEDSQYLRLLQEIAPAVRR